MKDKASIEVPRLLREFSYLRMVVQTMAVRVEVVTSGQIPGIL